MDRQSRKGGIMHWLFWDIENAGNSKVLHYWGKSLELSSFIISGSSKIPIPKEIHENKGKFDYLEISTFKKRRKDKADDMLVRSLKHHIEDGNIEPQDTVYLLSSDRNLNERFIEICNLNGIVIDIQYTTNLWNRLLNDIFIFRASKTIESRFSKKTEFVNRKNLDDTFKDQSSKVIKELEKKDLLIQISKRRWQLNIKNVEKKLFGSLKAA